MAYIYKIPSLAGQLSQCSDQQPDYCEPEGFSLPRETKKVLANSEIANREKLQQGLKELKKSF